MEMIFYIHLAKFVKLDPDPHQALKHANICILGNGAGNPFFKENSYA